MILGQSIFDAVLNQLNEENVDASVGGNTTPKGDWTSVRGLSTGFAGREDDDFLPTSSSQVTDAYFAFAKEEVAPEAPKFDYLDRLTPQQVAEDMQLSATDTAAELQAKRRAFARDNHPDRVGEEWRERATMRMKIANLLVDEALKRQKR